MSELTDPVPSGPASLGLRDELTEEPDTAGADSDELSSGRFDADLGDDEADPDDDLETASPDSDDISPAEPGEDLAAGPPGGI